MARQRVDRRSLRKFGLTVGGLLAALFGVAGPLLHHRPMPLWPWPPAALLVGAALVAPMSLRWPQTAWMRLAEALGFVNTRVILVVVFFLAVTPLGLARRLFGRAGRERWKKQTSYRMPSTRSDRMEAPY